MTPATPPGPTASTTTPPEPATPPTAAAPSPLAWLFGAWHGAPFDQRWVASAGAVYGVALTDTGFEVSIVGGGKLAAYPSGSQLSVTSVQPNRLDATDAHRAMSIYRGPGGLTSELTDPPNPSTIVTLAPAKLVRVPEVEAADRAFAADSAARGAVAWADVLAPGGVLQQGEQRLATPADVQRAMTEELAAGTLAWEPITSGRRGDLAFTVGEWHFRAGAGRLNGSYCTIWKRVGGTWRMLFDVGRPAAS